MNRRDFLAWAGASTGYSLWVKAGERDVVAAGTNHDQLVDAFDAVAPANSGDARAVGEPHLALVDLECDVFVAGGGMAGVCAAVAAARHGSRVVLCQDRSRLGGNASSEVKMHMVGADCHGSRPGWREGGLVEEFRLDDAANNPQRSWEMWDLLLYDKVKSEPNLTLLLDSALFAATTKDGLIQQVMVRCDKTEHLYRVKAQVYLDCTGDCRLGLEAGAEMRRGREARSEFGEALAMPQADQTTLGSSILFTARDYGRPIPFTPPAWARKVTRDHLKFRGVDSWEYGYWWIEWGGQRDTIRDNERIRFELLSVVLGVWDYIKNSGDKPASANWGLEWVGMIPGKRGSRRIVGEYLLTEHDLTGKNGEPPDAVAYGGWPMDDHPARGFDVPDQPAFTPTKVTKPYGIPLRCLCSRSVGNLMMAGRNVSASHVAFTSTRVMATCAALGQAAGTAAALCVHERVRPRELAADPQRVTRLQQVLLRDDQGILGLRNADPRDVARGATVEASDAEEGAEAMNVLSGCVRDLPGKTAHRWVAKLGVDGAWLELRWDQPQTVGWVQITFDTGFERQLTLSAQDEQNKRMIRGPQPETVRDYTLTAVGADGGETELVRVTGNHQRVRRHGFAARKVVGLRLRVLATHGAPTARVFEVRCHAEPPGW